MREEWLLELKAKLEDALENDLYEREDFDINDFQDQIYDMEYDLQDYSPVARGKESDLIEEVLDLISQVKEEYDFYDPDAEREFMFPDGEDD